MTRTAYGLDSGPEMSWRTDGACSRYDPDLWTSPEWGDRAQAVWVCINECPVREECYRWADTHRGQVDGSVYGGVMWTRGSSESRTPLPRPSLVPLNPMRPTGHPAHGDSPLGYPQARWSRAQCGTPNGYQRHTRNHEPVCEACRVACADRARARRAAS